MRDDNPVVSFLMSLTINVVIEREIITIISLKASLI